MSVQQKRLASLILKEHYGEVVEKVGCYLVAKGPRPLRDIIRETKLSRELVQKSLCCLIQHHFVTYEVNKRNVSLYNARISNILLRARAPRYIYCAKCLFGYSGELIVDEILQHGSVEMSKVVTKVVNHLTEENIDFDESEVKSTFADLVMNHFLQRVRTEIADDASTEDDLYSLPPGVTFQGGVDQLSKTFIARLVINSTRYNFLCFSIFFWDENYSSASLHSLTHSVLSYPLDSDLCNG